MQALENSWRTLGTMNGKECTWADAWRVSMNGCRLESESESVRRRRSVAHSSRSNTTRHQHRSAKQCRQANWLMLMLVMMIRRQLAVVKSENIWSSTVFAVNCLQWRGRLVATAINYIIMAAGRFPCGEQQQQWHIHTYTYALLQATKMWDGQQQEAEGAVAAAAATAAESRCSMVDAAAHWGGENGTPKCAPCAHATWNATSWRRQRVVLEWAAELHRM